jgi:membrane protein DedA with SNARE-associated domain
MFKIASLIWIILGTTLAGIALIVVLTIPQFANDSMRLIPIVCAAAAVVAIPLSMWIAKRIQAQTATGR